MSGSDKQSEGRHSYGASYARILRPLKWRRCTLLEIGIGGYESWAGGESLAAWRAYLPLGRVVGCDIVDKRVLARRRIDVRVVDQGDDDQLRDLAASVGPFDVVIDDGSHLNHHQISTFRALWPFVREGGHYVVEDVQTSYWPVMGGADSGDQNATTCMGWFSRVVHYVNAVEFLTPGDEELTAIAESIGSITFEHNLITVTKNSTPRVSSRHAPGQQIS